MVSPRTPAPNVLPQPPEAGAHAPHRSPPTRPGRAGTPRPRAQDARAFASPPGASPSGRRRAARFGPGFGGLIATALVFGAARTAAAQPKPPPPTAAPTATGPAPPSAPRTAPAIARVAEALARDLEPTQARTLVIAAPLVSDTAAPRAAQLVASLAAQLAGRRGKGARAHTEPAAQRLAREIARNETAFIYLSVEIALGQLRVAADVYPIPRTVWAKIRDPEPGPIAHAFAQAPIDAEVRGYLAPVPLAAALVTRAKNFEGDVVALACGDLDQDGALEIVSVSRRRVTTLRLRDGKVLPLASRSWPDLVGVHPAPLREPIGFATIVQRDPPPPDDPRAPARFLDLGLTDRARSVRLDGQLQLVATFGGFAVPDGDGTACTRTSGLVITGPVGPCMSGDPPTRSLSVGGQYDAFTSALLFTARGEPFTVWAGREQHALELRDDAGRKQILDAAGAQIAVGDLDQDGQPEIIASLDVQNPLEDAVVVRAWARTATPAVKLRETARLPAAAGVHAIAVCPPDGPGRAPFVVATADEIWVVR